MEIRPGWRRGPLPRNPGRSPREGDWPYEHPGESVPWRELLTLPIVVFGMGFLCGTLVWALRGLSRRFGLVGDALTGLIVMLVFFLCCMFLFAPAMLHGERSGRGPMLLLGTLVGLGGAWIGHDLRGDLEKGSGP